MPFDFEILDHADSPLGVFILRRLTREPYAIEIMLEHQFLMSSAVTVSERELASRAIAMHGGTKLDVMIGGLGLGYTAKAALDSDRVAHVEVVELVQAVIEWNRRGLVPLGLEVMADPRCQVTHDDVYERLRRAPVKQHDLLIIDVDHSPDAHLGESSDSFYAREGLELAKRHLARDGVFGVWSTSESPAFEAELRAAFREVRVDAIEFINEAVGGSETNWLFFARA
ncbi:MAG: spermidine synthase [Myxococcales bacterium]|nr:spermidine synthase [Myxococcales bacterium]